VAGVGEPGAELVDHRRELQQGLDRPLLDGGQRSGVG
jgi:hypothetical protein